MKRESLQQLLDKVKANIEVEYMPYDVYEFIQEEVNQDEWPDYSSLSIQKQNLLMVVDFEGQISNGGFEQYYHNSYGDNAFEATAALKTIGANTSADLLEKSFSTFRNGKSSKVREKRWNQLKSLSKKKKDYLEELANKFYDREDDIELLLTNYIKGNIDIFYT